MTATISGGPPPGEPVDITYAYDQPINRLWGIPLLGFFVRAILLIPHAVILWFYAVVVALTLLVSWIPVLITGRQADWVSSIIGGYLGWSIRVASYLLLVASPYPPFSGGTPYSVTVRIDAGQPINRLWGIPLVGIWVRALLCIPHYIVLFFVGIAVAIVAYVTWVPVLLLGRQAAPVIDLLGGYWRWTTRVSAYVLLLTDRYPPFRLGS